MSHPTDTVAAVAGAAKRLTIDQLAGVVKMTTRNIRAYQARGLLAPPALQGRTGYYGASHVERLEQIKRLQDEGMNLATIGKVLDGDSLAKALLEPFADEAPIEAPLAEFVERFGATPDDGVRAAALGLIELLDDDTARMLLPKVARRAEELVAMGVPLGAQLDAVEVAQRAAHEVADAFLELATHHLFLKVAADTHGDPDEIQAAVAGLEGIALDVVTALFRQAMTDRLGSILGNLDIRG